MTLLTKTEFPLSIVSAMSSIDKKSLTERDICTKFINPALEAAGWDLMHQIREQYYFTAGRVMVRGKTVKRGDRKFADYFLVPQAEPPAGNH